jgi:hypothetical protein
MKALLPQRQLCARAVHAPHFCKYILHLEACAPRDPMPCRALLPLALSPSGMNEREFISQPAGEHGPGEHGVYLVGWTLRVSFDGAMWAGSFLLQFPQQQPGGSTASFVKRP